MDWCLKPYGEANHYPAIAASVPGTIDAEAGEKITLDASGFTDPDEDKLSFRWWHYY
jgi:hypothetical protein